MANTQSANTIATPTATWRATWHSLLARRRVQEFVRRIVFSAAIGNADMHLKNWTLLYPDGRTPELSPAYDFVSTVAYLEDNVQMALSLTRREEDVRNINETLLRRFADKALMPAEDVLKPAIEISEKNVLTWKQIEGDLVMDPAAKQQVSERMNAFPLTPLCLSNKRHGRTPLAQGSKQLFGLERRDAGLAQKPTAVHGKGVLLDNPTGCRARGY
jgi:hypothetical protein